MVILPEQASAEKPAAAVLKNPAYSDKQPLWDLLVPGLVQFQANDGWMGALFLSGGIAGAGITGFAAYALSFAVNRQNIAADQVTKNRYSGYIGDAVWLLCGGAALWLGSAGLSTFHAQVQKTAQSANQPVFDASLYYSFKNAEIRISYYW